MSDLKELLARLADGATLSAEQAGAAFDRIMEGAASPAQIAAFLTALRVRGETVGELVAGSRALRARMTRVEAPENAIDTCGTGGDGKHTHNISTAAAFLIAGCGHPVAKHGNKAASSKSGSTDVLSALGVSVSADPSVIAEAIREAKIGFMAAPNHHGAMRHVGPTRAELGFRTIFNLLGPTANPAGVKRQVLGVFAPEWVEPMARTLAELGSVRAWVVHGADGLDELSTTGPSLVASLEDGAVRAFEVTPEEAGLSRCSLADLRGGTPGENAAAIEEMLEGADGPLADAAVFGAAAGLIVAGKAGDLKEGAQMAREAQRSGAAREALRKLEAICRAAA